VKPKGTAGKNNEHEVIKQKKKTELDKNAKKSEKKKKDGKSYCV
jgi:hypothetical protein